jgi:hypothetical protein
MMLTLTVMLNGALSGVPTAQAATTIAVSGVQVVSSESATNSNSLKTAVAYCPSNKRVIGGSGSIRNTFSRIPALTELRPVRLYDGTRDAYVVTAAETPSGTDANWSVDAVAVCANPLNGLSIVSATTTSSSSSMQATSASCSGGAVIGTGGRISINTGHVVLQVARPSGPGDIARVQAHETAAGYSANWSVTSYAVCVPTKPMGYEVVFASSPGRLSESVKEVYAFCPAGKQVLSSGAAITNVAPGHVSLQAISRGVGNTYARAVENTPTSLDWDFIVATAICAS